MSLKKIVSVLSVCSAVYSSSVLGVIIDGWGVTGQQLYQLSFDSNADNPNTATRSLIYTFDTAIGSMALSPDGGSLYAVSSVASDVYKYDFNTTSSVSIGQVPNGGFDLNGASTRGDEILMIDNGTSPKVWALDMNNASLSTEEFRTSATTSIGGRASSMVNIDNDTLLFFNDSHNTSSFARQAWTMENDGTTTLLGTVVDSLENEVQGFNASEMAADGLVYALDDRKIWEINYLGAAGGLVEATLVDEFAADSSAHGWTSVVFAPAVVPVPAAVWLFGSGLIGLVGVARRKKS